jgi:hypothetical protein
VDAVAGSPRFGYMPFFQTYDAESFSTSVGSLFAAACSAAALQSGSNAHPSNNAAMLKTLVDRMMRLLERRKVHAARHE